MEINWKKLIYSKLAIAICIWQVVKIGRGKGSFEMGKEADLSYKGWLETVGLNMWASWERDSLFDWLGVQTGLSLIGPKLEEGTEIRNTIRF